MHLLAAQIVREAIKATGNIALRVIFGAKCVGKKTMRVSKGDKSPARTPLLHYSVTPLVQRGNWAIRLLLPQNTCGISLLGMVIPTTQGLQNSIAPVFCHANPLLGTAVAVFAATEIEMTRKNMALVKVGVTKMSVPAKIQFTRQIVLDMSNNPNFAAPSPDLDTLSEAAAALESAYNSALQARANAKTQTSLMGQKSEVLDLLLMQEASYVQSTSGGDKAKIESAGFDVRDTPTPIGQLPAPAEPKAFPSQHSGTIQLSWKKVRGAKSYLIERAVDSNQSLEWAGATTSTKTKAVVNTMTSGLRYWFRVAAIGSAGQGAWSEPISKIAP